MRLIDLESTLITVAPGLSQLGALLRHGNVPSFDDVDFPRLKNYVAQNWNTLEQSLGAEEMARLRTAISAAEDYTRAWKEAEPRIFGRFFQRVYLAFSRPLARLGAEVNAAERLAKAFLHATAERWAEEGRIDEKRAVRLEASIARAESAGILKHLGAHLALSLALMVPIPGLRSAARFGWVLAFRIKARVALSQGRITPDEYRLARSTHSVPVMLLSLIPGLGTVAYFAAGPLIGGSVPRLLIDGFAHRLPFRLYHRLSLGRVTAPSRLTGGSSLGEDLARKVSQLLAFPKAPSPIAPAAVTMEWQETLGGGD